LRNEYGIERSVIDNMNNVGAVKGEARLKLEMGTQRGRKVNCSGIAVKAVDKTFVFGREDDCGQWHSSPW
jgi:hypothetical protein